MKFLQASDDSFRLKLLGWADKAQPPEARYSRLVKRIESFFAVINHEQRETSAVQDPVYQPN